MQAEQDSGLNSIKSALVVDDDEGARNLIGNYLKKLGVTEVVSVGDGQEAWELARASNFELIVLDWKLPRLSGLALFNRLRRHKRYATTPLLVVSGFVEKDDFRLLQEFPCTALVEKPFTKTLFENRVEEIVREAEWYGQNAALVDTILEAAGHEPKHCESLLKEVLKKAPNPVPLALISARRLTKANMRTSAEKVLRGVLAVDDQCLIAMSELGKVLHLGGEHGKALTVLRQANRLSPQNMQRLLLLGEVELNLADPESALAYFDKALEIDGDDRRAQAGARLAENISAHSLQDPEAGQRLPGSFASIVNTMGITFVRNGQFARGIEQYRAALSFLRSPTDGARVRFNLGLAYLRWGRSDEALGWFQKSEELGGQEFTKSARYVRRLVTSGKSVPFAAMEAMGEVTAEVGVEGGASSSSAEASGLIQLPSVLGQGDALGETTAHQGIEGNQESQDASDAPVEHTPVEDGTAEELATEKSNTEESNTEQLDAAPTPAEAEPGGEGDIPPPTPASEDLESIGDLADQMMPADDDAVAI